MSDASRRGLEREALDDEGAGRLLMERVRAGELDLEQIELLAYVGHPPAWAALGWEPSGFSANAGESMHAKLFRRAGHEDRLYEVALRPKPWISGLRRWGQDVVLRAAVAGTHHCFPAWKSRFRAEFGDALGAEPWGPLTPGMIEGLVRTTEAAVLFGSQDLWARAAELCHALRGTWLLQSAEGLELAPHFAFRFGRVAGYFAQESVRTSGYLTSGYFPWVVGSFEAAAEFLRFSPEPHSYREPVDWDARVRKVETALRDKVRDELAAWILGGEGDDPVRQRVAEIAAAGAAADE